MTLEEKVMAKLKDAMRAKDTHALNALRGIKTAIQMARTDGSGNVIDEAREMQIVQKLVKQRKESLAIYEQQNREDLALVERAEVAVLMTFLPAMMSDEALETALRNIIAEAGATSPKDMGRVMGLASKQLAGKAEGSAISAKVKQLLTA